MRLISRATKVATLVGLSASLVLATAGQAVAVVPDTGSFQYDIHYIDDGASAACGFTVTFDQLNRGTFQVFFDRQGNPVRVQVQTSVNGTASANGITLLVHGQENVFYDLIQGTQMDASLEFRVWLPGLGVVIMDQGRLLFDADGNVTFEAGPHPALASDFTQLCAALTP
jgi:hypothetical protein